MWTFATGPKAWLLSSAFLFGSPLIVTTAAQANQADGHANSGLKPTASYHAHAQIHALVMPAWDAEEGAQAAHFVGKRSATRSYGISCVPYARQLSGIQVAGNAWQWWNNAEGLYARGHQPEAGSVLDFRANGHMRLGHVAVVTRVINPREVVVDHANWPSGGAPGRVSRNVAIVDVSEANNWSAVRVEIGRDGTFGSIYPTYGFIYNRPDSGVMVASVAPPAPQAAINPVPSDLRPAADRPWRAIEEVAESPVTQKSRIDLGGTSAATPAGH